MGCEGAWIVRRIYQNAAVTTGTLPPFGRSRSRPAAVQPRKPAGMDRELRAVQHLIERLAAYFRIASLGGARPSVEFRRVVFVCTGNICRSPFAEALARKMGLEAISCGTRTDPDLPANQDAILHARAFGIDLQSHRTCRWEDVKLKQDDLIVAAELHHFRSVRRRAVSEGCRVVLMSGLLNGRFSLIADPYGRGAEEFGAVYSLISQAVRELVRLRGKRGHAPDTGTDGR